MARQPIGDMTAARAEIERAARACVFRQRFQRVEILAGGVDGALHIGLGTGTELVLHQIIVGTGHLLLSLSRKNACILPCYNGCIYPVIR